MGLFNYTKAKNKYRNNDDMLETIRRLKDFDEFHCLRDSNLLVADSVSSMIPFPNKEFIGWMTICDGGLLFDTTLLSVQEFDNKLNLEFSTFSQYNEKQSYEEFGLPAGYYIIGIRSYGDPICISSENSKIYLWDCEQGEFTTIWENFYDFVGDEVDSAIDLLKTKDLSPIPLKIL